MDKLKNHISAKRVRKNAFDFSPAGIIATWFGCGFLPLAPGTWGSVAALPVAWVIAITAGPLGLVTGVVVVFLIGIWAVNALLKRSGEDDPGSIVIDEVAGQWLTLIAVAPGVMSYGIGFIYFRLFDIFKPWPISWADRKLKGAFGVMADDILAGTFAAGATCLTLAGLNAIGVA
jgi:phosphatidylglycerophosphatase A